ncbi:hypothetical protein [Ketogulonicigenium vulgare]|uniref:hypothetical protein n=1 Tax=Ketogulonicigenium vulgare TaxID=92945 RepID=UPI002359D76A|nr:hypothetical protein [Ketogulonicigenium vulgare]
MQRQLLKSKMINKALKKIKATILPSILVFASVAMPASPSMAQDSQSELARQIEEILTLRNSDTPIQTPHQFHFSVSLKGCRFSLISDPTDDGAEDWREYRNTIEFDISASPLPTSDFFSNRGDPDAVTFEFTDASPAIETSRYEGSERSYELRELTYSLGSTGTIIRTTTFLTMYKSYKELYCNSTS